MNIMELFELLDIENASEFKYFDNFADLMESDENIDYEVIHELIYQVDPETVSGLISDYFTDIIEGVPDYDREMFMLIDNIRRVMKGLADNSDDESHMARLADEIYKFRNWYNFDTDVICSDNKTGERKILPVRDALVLYREEKLRGTEYSYDFEGCTDYEIDEYVVSLDMGNENDDYDYSTGNEEEALLNSDFLYDDDFKLEE